MTTTTRTRGATAKVLAAFMAVLALVAATLAFTATSASAGEGKVWICHADVNGTNGPGGPQSGDPNGQDNLGQGGTGGEFQIGFNLIEVSVNAWENAHQKLHPSDYIAFEKNGEHSCTPFKDVPDTYTATKYAEAEFCWETAIKTVRTEGTDSFTTVDGLVPDATKTAVETTAQTRANDALTALLASTYAARTPVPADRVCTMTYATTTTVQASTWICLSTLTTSVSVAGPVLTFPVGPQATPITPADVTAVQSANQGAARTALVNSLNTAYPGYVETISGADCTNPPPPPSEGPEAVTAADAATVAPVLPATVPVEAPETVAVPAPATVAMPAAVPAGDGSTVPQVPVALLALLALLALATAAAVTSGLRMATNR